MAGNSTRYCVLKLYKVSIHCPKRILEGEMFLCICGNVFCLLWKCFIYSNFLTGVVKIIVITTNISLITFQFWCGNMLSQVRARLC